jgi:glutamyl-tRNA synthetase
MILDMQGRKLSKRDGDVDVHSFRKAGYLPEALVNFIALLGWNPGGGRERLSMRELIELFSLDRIGKSNAKFDREKRLAFNTAAAAAADEARLLERFADYLSLNETPIPAGDEPFLRRLLRINKGFRTFADIPARCGVLFRPDSDYAFDEKAVAKVLAKGEPGGYAVLGDVRGDLAEVAWEAAAIEAWLEKFCAARGLGMGKVAQPIRVAVTGGTVSPQIVQTLLLLGRDKTLARIDRCLAGRVP